MVTSNFGTSGVRRIASPWILLPGGKLERGGLVTFAPDGTLTDLRTGVTQIDNLSTTEHYSGVLIPSMVNAHNHLELSYFEGKIPQATGLVEFARHIATHREETPIAERIRRAEVQNRKMWAEGTGAVGDISNSAFSLATKAGTEQGGAAIYYHTFGEYYGMPPHQQSQTYFHSKTDPILEEAARVGVVASATPHSTYLVGDQIFKMARDSARVSIHFMETPSEVDFFKRKGGMYESLTGMGMKPDFLHYGSHVERLVESLPRELPLLLVHCTQMVEEEIARVLESFDDVTFVLCPRSNYYIERGFPPAELLLTMGARVALGTDSLCSNWSLSLISEVEWLARHTNIPLGTLLSWATEGGAAGLGIEERMGRFAVGTKCGAVLVEGFSNLGRLSLDDQKPIFSKRLI